MAATRDPDNDRLVDMWNQYGEKPLWECWDDGGAKSWRATCLYRGGCAPTVGVDVSWLTLTAIERDGQPLTEGVDWAIDEDPGGDSGDGIVDPWKFVQFTEGMAENSEFELFGTLV